MSKWRHQQRGEVGLSHLGRRLCRLLLRHRVHCTTPAAARDTTWPTPGRHHPLHPHSWHSEPTQHRTCRCGRGPRPRALSYGPRSRWCNAGHHHHHQLARLVLGSLLCWVDGPRACRGAGYVRDDRLGAVVRSGSDELFCRTTSGARQLYAGRMRARRGAARASRASSLVMLLLSLIACGGLQQSYGTPPHRAQRVERAELAVVWMSIRMVGMCH